MSAPPPSRRRRRDGVHAELTALRGLGGPLHVSPNDLTAYFTDSVQRDVVFQYREQRPDAPSDGRAVIVTAGPPGAGKSSFVSRLAADHRQIDPDEIKDLLLTRAEDKGLLAVRYDHVLSDGHPVSPRELSWWVHGVANDIADEVRRISLEAGENIVIEGTLRWGPLAGQYTDELANQDYERLVVLDVEVPVETAIEQARSRWWGGRTGADSLGGRFMADVDVAAYYETSRVSTCATTARALYEEAQAAEIESELIVVSRSPAGRRYGARLRPEGVSSFGTARLSVPCLRCGHLLTAKASIARGIGPGCVTATT